MKISFLEDYLSINGSIRHIIELSNALILKGHTPIIYSLDTHCKWLECNAEIRPQSQVLTDSHDALIFNKASRAQWQMAEAANTGRKLFYIMGMSDGVKGRKIVTEWLTSEGGKKGHNNTLKSCLDSSDYTILVNGTWMHSFLAEIGFESHMVLSGVNLQMFRPLDTRAETPTVVISGDPRARYETKVIERAVEIARTRLGELDLISYFGKGIPQSEMAAFISQGWVFADAQNRAGWNNPPAEAMACGVPVICTDIGGNRDFAEHDRTAIMVNVGDYEAMANEIVRLIEHKPIADYLAGNALEKIKRFTWERSAEQLIGVLEDEP